MNKSAINEDLNRRFLSTGKVLSEMALSLKKKLRKTTKNIRSPYSLRGFIGQLSC